MELKELAKIFERSSFYYLIAIGMDSCYMYVSPNYDQNFKARNLSLLGEPFHITLHPDDIKICEEVGMQCFQDPSSLHPATLRKNDGFGGYIFTQWEFKAMMDDMGKPKGIYCIGYNVTEHIATQKELEIVNNQVSKQYLALNEIAFINSHVVRRPLANILGLTSILNQMDLDENLKMIIKMLVESASDLEKAIKHVTDKTDS